MARVALSVEYDGSFYNGFQWQPDVPSIAASLQGAVSEVANHDLHLTAAGRTDAGVHALNQIVHFDTTAERRPHNWLFGINTHLPSSIKVHWANSVSDEFNARFSALARRYIYVIINHSSLPALWQQRAICWHKPLDTGKMQQAAGHLLGERDFSSFQSSECQSSTPMRRIDAIKVKEDGKFVVIDITANAFLHHMVRNIAGTLLMIGEARYDTGWIERVLMARDRKQAGITAPAQGLYFVSASYPDHFGLPLQAAPDRLTQISED